MFALTLLEVRLGNACGTNKLPIVKFLLYLENEFSVFGWSRTLLTVLLPVNYICSLYGMVKFKTQNENKFKLVLKKNKIKISVGPCPVQRSSEKNRSEGLWWPLFSAWCMQWTHRAIVSYCGNICALVLLQKTPDLPWLKFSESFVLLN